MQTWKCPEFNTHRGRKENDMKQEAGGGSEDVIPQKDAAA